MTLLDFETLSFLSLMIPLNHMVIKNMIMYLAATRFFRQQRDLQKALCEDVVAVSPSASDHCDVLIKGERERAIKAVHQKLGIGPVAQNFEGVSSEILKALEDPGVFVACSASLNHSTGLLLDIDKNDEVTTDHDRNNKESSSFFSACKILGHVVVMIIVNSVDFVSRFYRNVRHWLGFQNLPPHHYRIVFGHSDNAVMQSSGKGSLVAVSQEYDYCDNEQTTIFVKKSCRVKMTDLVYNEGQKFNIISSTRLLMDGWTLGRELQGVWFEKDGVRLTFYFCSGFNAYVFTMRVSRCIPKGLDEHNTP